MIGPYEIHGHAIISADQRIADRDGRRPASLRFAADQIQFNAALDAARVVILGRKGHLAHPDRRRNRLVISSLAGGIERRADAWWWNPAGATALEALGAAAPGGGLVVVAGGTRILDLFLELGYDRFHLARAPHVTLPGGAAVFSDCDRGKSADDVLAEHGMVPGPTALLDPEHEVTLTVWHGPAPRPVTESETTSPRSRQPNA
jgi:hypothetical protein